MQKPPFWLMLLSYTQNAGYFCTKSAFLSFLVAIGQRGLVFALCKGSGEAALMAVPDRFGNHVHKEIGQRRRQAQ